MIIDKKWKYIAKDKGGESWLFTEKPILANLSEWITQNTDYVSLGTKYLTDSQYQDSLHEIIHLDNNTIQFKKVNEMKPDIYTCIDDNGDTFVYKPEAITDRRMNLEINRVKVLFNPNTQYRINNISNLLKQHAQLFEAITDELDEISEPLALSVL